MEAANAASNKLLHLFESEPSPFVPGVCKAAVINIVHLLARWRHPCKGRKLRLRSARLVLAGCLGMSDRWQNAL